MRPRVSILNLLLVTTVVALGFTVFQLYAELQKEKSLRRELLQKGGILQVSDPEAVHVVQVTSRGERNTRRWRVYVPPGRTVTINTRLESVPADKPLTPRLPPTAIVVAERAPSNAIKLDAGEHVVSLYSERESPYLSPYLSLEAVGPGSRRGRPLEPSDSDLGWFDAGYVDDITNVEHAPRTFNELTSSQTIKLNDGETFVLCRCREPKWAPVLRAHQNKSPVKPSDKVGEVLIWLHADGG